MTWHRPSPGTILAGLPIHPPAAGAIQTKLAINKPGDGYEQEADRVSEQVMRHACEVWVKVAAAAPCNKADDRIINDPLRVEMPSLNCEPVGETLAAVRSVPGVPQDILGVTRVSRGGLSISFKSSEAAGVERLSSHLIR